VLCSWHKTKSHICLHRQSFIGWLNLEGFGDKKKKKKKKNRPKCSPNRFFLSTLTCNFYPVKSSAKKITLLLYFSKKSPKCDRPIGENSPNLVTVFLQPPMPECSRSCGTDTHCQTQHVKMLLANTVTRLGEFSPFGRLFTLSSFVKISEVAKLFGLHTVINGKS
jgi:hypothetical protein